MKHVKRYQDRQGSERLYFRKAGHPRNGEPLTSPWPEVEAGSALMAEVTAILATQIAKPRPGHLAGATRDYELSADFTGLGSETKYGYRLILKEFDADLGTLPLVTFTHPTSSSAKRRLRAAPHLARDCRQVSH
jgi:hypothetical protein